jgi:AcrR family transcriptional regulator
MARAETKRGKRPARGERAPACKAGPSGSAAPPGASRKTGAAAQVSGKPAKAVPRAERQAARREAILSAALDEFSSRGFAATRLDDIAARAGVAKGTIYLYFRDKEDLFHELVRAMLSPIVGRLEAAPMAELPARMLVEAVADIFVREIFGTRRKDVIRLIITEGQRFPNLAEVYYREVIGRAVPVMRGLMQRAVERGEFPNDALARFPQLLIAPALVALVWNGLFDRFAPLDVREFLRAHIALLFGERTAP